MKRAIYKYLKDKSIICIISILVIFYFEISLLISYEEFSRNNVIDYNRGNIKEQSVLDIKGKNEENLDVDEIIKICNRFTKDNTIYIRGLSYVCTNLNKSWVIPVELVSVNDTTRWHPKITNGRYFDKNEIINSEKIAVVGASISKKEIFNHDIINITNDEFTVVGQAGELENKSSYTDTVFIPLNTAPNDIKKGVKEVQIRIYNEKNVKKQSELLAKELHSNLDLNIEYIRPDNSKIFYKSLLVVISVIVIMVSITFINLYTLLKIYIKEDENLFEGSILKSKIFYKISGVNIISVVISYIIRNFINIDNLVVNYVNLVISFVISIFFSFAIYKIIKLYEGKGFLAFIESFKFKKVISVMNLTIAVMSLSIVLYMVGKISYYSIELNEILDCNHTYNLEIYSDKNEESIEELNKKFNTIKNNECIKECGRFYLDKIKIKEEDVRGLFIDNIDMYKFDIKYLNNITTESEYVELLVSNDLSERYNLGDVLNISINHRNVKGKVIGVIEKGKFKSGNLKYDVSVEELKNTIVIPFGKKNFYDKNIDYAMFSNVVAEGENDNFKNIVKKFKEDNLINTYSRYDKYLGELKEIYMRPIEVLSLISLMFCMFYLSGILIDKRYLLSPDNYLEKRLELEYKQYKLKVDISQKEL